MKASILRTPVSGLSHTKFASTLADLAKGDPLFLKAIGDNEYDPFAIAVCADPEHELQLGWIPKGKNEVLHNLIEQGFHISAVCSGNDPLANREVRLHVMVWLDTEGI
jgi:hypothetical protein